MTSLNEKLGTIKEDGSYNPSSWGKDCMDFFDFVGAMQTQEKKKDWANYQLFNGQYEMSNYDYVVTPYSDQFGELPAQIRHFSIVSAPIKVLYGEMKEIPLTFFCKAEDQENKNEFIRTKSKLLMDFVQQQIMQSLQSQGVDMQNQEQVQAMTPPDIEDYMAKSYTGVVEQWAQSALQYEMKKNDMRAKMLEGFKDGLIAGKEFYMSTVINNEPIFKLLNPLYIFYDKSLDVEFIDEGDFAGIRPFLTPSEVIATWGKYLSEKQIEEVLKYGNFGRSNTWNNSTGPSSIQFDTDSKDILFTDQIFSGNNMNDMFNNLFTGQSTMRLGRLPVTTAFWKSKRKLGYLHYFDENQEEQIMLVDENYKAQKNQGEWIEWDWVNQVWEGTKIGTDIYLNIRPMAYQGVSINRVYECRLPITGGLYNSRNSRPTSILDEMKPYQEAFNIYMYKLEQDFNSEMGKVMLMSLRHIPNRKGWDEKKWLWYLKALKIAWIDDSVENLKGQQSNFNQFHEMDLSLGDQIQKKIEVLEWLKNQCNYIAGITPERLGQTQQTETMGGIERSVRQSATQSELYFQQHQRICQRALTIHLNTCQVAYADNTELSFFQNDMSRSFIQIDGGRFSLADLSVFVTDGVEDYRVLNALRSLAQPAMQNGADLADIATIQITASISEIKDKLEKVKRERIQREQQQAQMQQQAVEAQMKDKADTRAWQAKENQLDRENKITVAEITHDDADVDNNEVGTNDNDIPDSIDYAQLAIDQQAQNLEQTLGLRNAALEERRLALEQKKVANESRKVTAEIALSKEELKIKKIAEANKVRIARMKPKTPSKK